MNHSLLLDLATDLGYELAMCGAETFRVEESINLILAAYGVKGEVFAIPNCLTVSIICQDGQPMTRMRRIGYHGNDLDSVERFSGLSRAICNRKPEPQEAILWLEQTRFGRRKYRLPIYLAGNFLGAAGFAVFFGGSLIDSLCAGVCGMLVGLMNSFMDHLKANLFFRTLAAAFPMALLAYAMGQIGLSPNPDSAVIGALMILVPGLLFTNAMRDIIFGDTNSGVNRIVQVLLVAVAIACGTAAAWNTAAALWGVPASGTDILYPFSIQGVACFIGCFGFSILFNIHGPGMLVCAFGGLLTWAAYGISMYAGAADLTAYFLASICAAAYSEAMARMRKYPAISYLVVAIFPLIPGAGVYYTMNFAVRGEMELFAQKGMHTAAVAGIMAVGILMVSTVVRIITLWLRSRKQTA